MSADGRINAVGAGSCDAWDYTMNGIKISKLTKKGKFTATVSLTDNPFYNDIIKKVKIRIV